MLPARAPAPPQASADVSVVIAVRGPAPGLAAAIDSACGQSHPPAEIVVVDDGSAPPISLPTTDPRVRLLRLPANVGPAAARNRGVEAASGAWIAFLDADDAWYPDKLERQLAGRDPSDQVLIGCDAWIVEGDARRRFNGTPPSGSLDTWILVHQRSLQTSGLVLPRALALSTPFDERLRACEDWDFVLQLDRAGVRIAYIDACLYEYRRPPRIRGTIPAERLAAAVAWLVDGPADATARGHHYIAQIFAAHLRAAPIDALRIVLRMGRRTPGFPRVALRVLAAAAVRRTRRR